MTSPRHAHRRQAVKPLSKAGIFTLKAGILGSKAGILGSKAGILGSKAGILGSKAGIFLAGYSSFYYKELKGAIELTYEHWRMKKGDSRLNTSV